MTKEYNSLNTENPWTIINSYFHNKHLNRLVRHQLESYNNFVEHQIYKTINMFNPVNIFSENDVDASTEKKSLEIEITFKNFGLYRPQVQENNGSTKLMFPQEARLRNFTYASSMVVDVHIKYFIRTGPQLENLQVLHKVFSQIHIGKMPIMLKSSICVLTQHDHLSATTTGECKFDTGGYFIIHGSEKTVIAQERAAENRVYCFNISKNNTKYTWMAEIKSIPDFKSISPKQISVMISSKDNGLGFPIVVQIPRTTQPIPIFILFRALGVISDEDICKIITLNNDKKKQLLKCLMHQLLLQTHA